MAGGTMGGSSGGAGIYDPQKRNKENKGKTGYWGAVQSDLNKQENSRKKGKTTNKKVGR